MSMPSRNRNWLKEVRKAYSIAEKRLAKREITSEYLYTLAPEIMASNRGIVSKKTIEAMLNSAKSDVAYEKKIEPESCYRYKFHFVSAYIFGHVAAGILSEKECDQILSYINDEWDLFDHA
jgi:hypothetical protein